MRRIVLLALLVLLVLAGLWSLAWHVLAGRLETAVAKAIAAPQGGVAIACGERSIAGFPFRLSVHCDHAGLQDGARGLTAAVAGVRASLGVYDPRAVALAFSAPAEIKARGLAAPVALDWEEATGRVGLRGDEASLAASGVSTGWKGMAVRIGALTARIAPADALVPPDASLTAHAASASVQAGGKEFPALDIDLSARIGAAPAALLSGGFDPRLEGLEIPDLRLALASPDLDAVVRGALQVTAGGVANGKLTLSVAEVDKLPQAVASLPQELRGFANAVVAGLLAFGRAGERDGKPVREVDLVVDQGKLSIAMFSAGRLPPLW
ncbi:DUF2125 domain-containing protein [Propylenella binzhouense]|uniref:DUF2125 domain-containing protein n=1 Tax=Propylenella binzhouense TaxID=2555902 RepID=A0A964WUJ0_9HYPH|nr:DUF2125 domain-containing protein [Propylenella binzhouense]MYZ49177.1 DUF2125 domain-containing protein [Propylenella binzhouense]